MKNLKTLVTLFTILFCASAWAATVTQVKNNKVMVSLDGETAAVGDEFFVVNAQGKKVAIIRVSQVKGGKAIADVTKGKAAVGYSLQAKGGGAAKAPPAAESSGGGDESYYDRKLSQRDNTGNSYGLVAGYLMNSMTAKFKGGTSVSPYDVTATMSGTGFGAVGFYDYAFSPSITLRGMAGVEQYNVAGTITTADCTLTTQCNVKLTYLSMYGYARWNYMSGKYKGWLGGGAGYLYAMSKNSTVLKQDQLSANQIFMFATGLDIRMSASSYIPISVEYGMFPTSPSVSANIIYLRFGYAWYL